MKIIKLAARKLAQSEDALIENITSRSLADQPCAFAVSGPCAAYLDKKPAEGEEQSVAEAAFKAAMAVDIACDIDADGNCVLLGQGVFCLGAKRISDDSKAKEYARLKKNLEQAASSVTAVVLIDGDGADAPKTETPDGEALKSETPNSEPAAKPKKSAAKKAKEVDVLPEESADDAASKLELPFDLDFGDASEEPEVKAEAPQKKPAKKKAAAKKSAKTDVAEEAPKRVQTPLVKKTYEAPAAIEHPTWGHGVVIEASGDVFTVEFESVGVKKISAEWVQKNIR